jgi:hypothetical protein
MMTNKTQDDIIEQAAKMLQEEIDWEILAGTFVQSGWTMIDLPRFHSNKEAIDVADWIETTCKGKHMKRGKTFVFEKKQDAEWFVLRWQ